VLLPRNMVFQGQPYPRPRAATCFGNVKLRLQRRSDMGLQRGARPRIADDRTGSTERTKTVAGCSTFVCCYPWRYPSAISQRY
jgi:hypothetical protein